MKQCPFCAEDVKDKAIVCKHCNKDLVKSSEKYNGVFIKTAMILLIVFIPVLFFYIGSLRLIDNPINQLYIGYFIIVLIVSILIYKDSKEREKMKTPAIVWSILVFILPVIIPFYFIEVEKENKNKVAGFLLGLIVISMFFYNLFHIFNFVVSKQIEFENKIESINIQMNDILNY